MLNDQLAKKQFLKVSSALNSHQAPITVCETMVVACFCSLAFKWILISSTDPLLQTNTTPDSVACPSGQIKHPCALSARSQQVFPWIVDYSYCRSLR